MPIDLTIEIDKRQKRSLERTLARFGKDGQKMLGYATTDTLRRGKKLVKDEISGELKLKRGKVAKSVSHKKLGRTSGVIRVSSKRAERLINFQRPSQTKKGVKVGVRKGRARELKRSAFIAIGKGGVKQVFRRVLGTKERRLRTVRQGGKLVRIYRETEAIRALPGPTPYGVVTGNPAMLPRIMKRLAKIQMSILKRKVDSLFRETRRG